MRLLCVCMVYMHAIMQTCLQLLHLFKYNVIPCFIIPVITCSQLYSIPYFQKYLHRIWRAWGVGRPVRSWQSPGSGICSFPMLLGQSSASGFRDQNHGPNKQYQEHSYIMQKGICNAFKQCISLLHIPCWPNACKRQILYRITPL